MDDRLVLDVWGKSRGFVSPYPLLAHLVDTASVAYSYLEVGASRQMLRILGVSSDVERRRFAFVAGLHDVGKAIPGFQGQVDASRDALIAAGFDFPAGRRIDHFQVTQWL